MTSGPTFSRELERSIDQVQDQIRHASSRYGALLELQSSTHASVARSYRDIARTATHALEAGEIEANDHVLARVAGHMAQRDAERSRLQLQLPNLQSALDIAVASRDAAQYVHDYGNAVIDLLVTEADQRLGQDSLYLALVSSAEAAEQMAIEGRKRSEAAAIESNRKLVAFRKDPVFSYLAGRQYGTGQYQANPFVRMVDGWLARLCRYDRTAEDFRNLVDLPSYLSAHADRMEANAIDAAEKVRAAVLKAHSTQEMTEVKAMAGANALKLKAASVAVDLARHALRDVNHQLLQLNQWSDPEGVALLSSLSDALGKESIDALEARVAATSSTVDDECLSVLRGLRKKLAQIDPELLAANREIETLKARCASLRTVRDRFRQADYTDSRYTIGGNASDLLAGMLLGQVSSNDLWVGIQRSAHYEPPRQPSRSWYDDSSSSSGSSIWGGSDTFTSGDNIGGGGDSFSSGGDF